MTTSSNWHGWIWIGDAWERVCTAPTLPQLQERDSSLRLNEQGQRRGVPDKHQVLTGGGSPAFVPENAAQAILSDANSISYEEEL